MAWSKILKNGFRKGGSCLNNRLQFLDQVTRSIDVHIVYLDFAKAFDEVPHSRLLEKLEKHGIGGKVWSWVRACLSDRLDVNRCV